MGIRQIIDAQEISNSVDGSGNMITVHRLNGQPFVINALHIVSIERTPDTLLTLFGGDKLLVADSVEAVVAGAEAFVRVIGTCAAASPTPGKDA